MGMEAEVEVEMGVLPLDQSLQENQANSRARRPPKMMPCSNANPELRHVAVARSNSRASPACLQNKCRTQGRATLTNGFALW